MRHSWSHNKEKKQSTCRRCDLQVKTYKIKKGGLPRCNPENALKQKISCNNHIKAAVAGACMCWNCGQIYTSAELEAGKIKMERHIDSALIENPPPHPI